MYAQSSTVNVVRNNITVMLSKNIDNAAAKIGNTMKTLMGLYFSFRATLSAIQLKKPDSESAATIVNMPKISAMVSQLTC